VITLAQARSRVRRNARYKDTDSRLDDPTLDDIIYEKELVLRTQLQEIAPSYGLTTVSGIVLDADCAIDLSGGECPLARVYRVERLFPGVGYREVQVAHYANPNMHMIPLTWRQEGCKLLFGPDALPVGETIRVTYWTEPGQTTVADDDLPIPSGTESVLTHMATAGLYARDGDDDRAQQWDARADAELARVKPTLRMQHGVQQIGGLARVLGY